MKFLNYLNGKKTAIAAGYNTAVPLLFAIYFGNGVPEIAMKIHLTIGVIFTIFGLGHKAIKAGQK